jgi:hypothetical protein
VRLYLYLRNKGLGARKQEIQCNPMEKIITIVADNKNDCCEKMEIDIYGGYKGTLLRDFSFLFFSSKPF